MLSIYPLSHGLVFLPASSVRLDDHIRGLAVISLEEPWGIFRSLGGCSFRLGKRLGLQIYHPLFNI